MEYIFILSDHNLTIVGKQQQQKNYIYISEERLINRLIKKIIDTYPSSLTSAIITSQFVEKRKGYLLRIGIEVTIKIIIYSLPKK